MTTSRKCVIAPSKFSWSIATSARASKRALANRAVSAGALEQEVRAPVVALRAVDLSEHHERVGVRRIERQRFL